MGSFSRGLALADIARETGASLGHVRRTLWGERESPRIRAYLTALLGRDVLAPDFDDYPKDIAPDDPDSAHAHTKGLFANTLSKDTQP